MLFCAAVRVQAFISSKEGRVSPGQHDLPGSWAPQGLCGSQLRAAALLLACALAAVLLKSCGAGKAVQ